jgi:hypothetical protein
VGSKVAHSKTDAAAAAAGAAVFAKPAAAAQDAKAIAVQSSFEDLEDCSVVRDQDGTVQRMAQSARRYGARPAPFHAKMLTRTTRQNSLKRARGGS